MSGVLAGPSQRIAGATIDPGWWLATSTSLVKVTGVGDPVPAGTSWQQASLPTVLSGLGAAPGAVSFSPLGGWRMVTEGTAAVWRSADGLAWERVPLPSGVSTAKVAIDDQGQLLAAYVVPQSFGKYEVRAVRYTNGQWYQPIVVTLTPSLAYAPTIVGPLSAGSTWLMVTNGGLWYSTNNGLSWSVSSGTSGWGSASLTVIGGKVHVVTPAGYGRWDIATHSVDIAIGSLTGVPAGLVMSSPGSVSNLWIVGSTVAYSSDGGGSWSPVAGALGTPPFVSGGSSSAYFMGADGLMHCRRSAVEGGVIVVYDFKWDLLSGHWTTVSRLVTTLTAGTLQAVSTQRADGTAADTGSWLSTSSSLSNVTGAGSVTTMGVSSVQATRPTLLSGLAGATVEVSPSSAWRLVQESSSVVWRSHDDVTWERIPLPVATTKVAIGDSGELLASFGSGYWDVKVMRFADGLWFEPVVAIHGSLVYPSFSAPMPAGSLWLVRSQAAGLYYSADGGFTWSLGTPTDSGSVSFWGSSLLDLQVAGGKVYAWNRTTSPTFSRWDIATKAVDVGESAGIPYGTVFTGGSGFGTTYLAYGGAGLSLNRWVESQSGVSLEPVDQKYFPYGMTSSIMQQSSDNVVRFYAAASCSASTLVYGAEYNIATGVMSSHPIPLYLDESKTTQLLASPGASAAYPTGWNAILSTQSSGLRNVLDIRGSLAAPEAVFGLDSYGYTVGGVNSAIGGFTRSWTDLDIAGVGPALQLTRTYNSADQRVGMFGQGWTSSFEARVFENCVTNDVTVLFGDGRRETHYSDGAGGYLTPPGYTTRLTKDGTSGWTLTGSDGSAMTFRADGRMTSMADADGQSLAMTWDGSNRLTTVTDPLSGRALTFAYTNGLVTSVSTSPVTSGGVTAPLTWNYSYTGSNLAKACEPRNNSVTTGWCTSYTMTDGVLTQVADANGHTDVKVGYSDGRVGWVEDGVGARTTYAYVGTSKTVVTDPNGHATTSEFDGLYRLVKLTNAAGGVTQYHYDAAGMRDQVTDPLGHTTLSTFDAQGNVLSTTDPLGHTTWFAYDAFNNQTSTRDPRSSGAGDNTYATVTTWDGIHHNKLTETTPATTQQPVGTTLSWTYTTGAEAAIDGGLTPVRLMKASVDANGGVTAYRYDAKGNLREVTDASGLLTRYTYDELGRQVSVTTFPTGFPTGVSTTFVLDADGRTITRDDPAQANGVTSQIHRRRQTSTYDPAGNLTQVIESDIGGSTWPDASRTTSYSYDNADRQTSMVNPAGGASSQSFDPAGQVVESVDANGQHVTFTYDPRGLVLTRTAVAAAVHEGTTTRVDVVEATATYDAAGRPLTTVNALGVATAFDYDTAGRVVRKRVLGYHTRGGGVRDVTVEETTYDAAGNPIVVASGGGLRTEERTYDEAGRLVQSVLDPAGLHRVSDMVYDPAGHVVRRTVTQGTSSQEVRYTLDAGGRTLSQTVENGATDLITTYTYDNRGLTLSRVSANGNAPGAVPADFRTTFELDALGHTVHVMSPAVSVTTNGVTTGGVRPDVIYGFDTFGDATDRKDENGNVTTQTFDVLGRVVHVDYPSTINSANTTVQSSESFSYDAVGNTVSHTDRRGYTTNYEFDGLNRAITKTDPAVGTNARGVTTTWYDDAGHVMATVSPNGARVEQTYDDLGRVRTRTSVVRNQTATPDSFVTTYDYDDLGHQTYQRTPAGEESTATFNPAGEQTSATDATAATTSFTHDVAGQTLTTTDPLGRVVADGYDAAGRHVSQARFDNNNQLLTTSTTSYDAEGHVLSATSPRGNVTGANQADFTITYTYDALGRLVSSDQPISTTDSITTGYRYDRAGNLTSQTDGRGNTTLYSYNEWNLQTAIIEPATQAHPTSAERTWLTDFDSGGLPIQTTQPGGIVVANTYDELGRLVNQTGSGTGVTTASRHYGYDNAGNTTSIASPNGDVTLTWDDSQLLVATGGPTQYQSQYTYDADGRMIARADATGTATFTWTTRGQLATATDPLTGVTRQNTFDAAGQLTAVSYGSGHRTLGYDPLGRLSSDVLSTAGGTVTAGYAYGYDADGNVTSIDATLPGNSAQGANSYSYDTAGRLISWTKPDNSTVTYSWDKSGNLTANAGVTATFDERNEVLTSGATSYTWSARGTLDTTVTGAGTTVSEFDALGRLATNGTTTYTYDALDRVAATTSGDVAYAGLEIDPVQIDGTLIARSPSGTPLATQTGTGNATLVGRTRHGDVGYQFAADGTVASTTVYDPFGALAAHTGPANVLGYQSDYTDPTSGDVWMGARWYRPGVAGFTSRDTVHGNLANPVSLNRYTYAWNDPLGMWDPDGREPTCSVAEGAALCKREYQPLLLSTNGCGSCTIHDSRVSQFTMSRGAYQDYGGDDQWLIAKEQRNTCTDLGIYGLTRKGAGPAVADACAFWQREYDAHGGDRCSFHLWGHTCFSGQEGVRGWSDGLSAVNRNKVGIATFAVIGGVAVASLAPVATAIAERGLMAGLTALGEAMLSNPAVRTSVAGLGGATYGLISGQDPLGSASESEAAVDLGFGPTNPTQELETLPSAWTEEATNTANGAANAATGPALARQLAGEEASSIFTTSGGLKPSVIDASTEIIPGTSLSNGQLIKNLTADGSSLADWGKYTTPTFNSPSGPFQVHFYMNPSTGVVHYLDDFKVVFNGPR